VVLLRWRRSEKHEFSKAHWVRGDRGQYEIETLCGGRVPVDAFIEMTRHMEFFGRRCRDCEAVVSDLGRRLHQHLSERRRE